MKTTCTGRTPSHRARLELGTRRPFCASLLALLLLLAPARAQSCLVEEGSAHAEPPVEVQCKLATVDSSRLFPVTTIERERCRERPVKPPCNFCKVVECQLSRECGQGGGRSAAPTADTVFARRGREPDLPPNVRKALIAATLSQKPQLALELTASARSDPSPPIRYAATLTAALVILKSDQASHRAALEGLVSSLMRDAEGLPFPAADAEFLTAQIAAADGKPGKALQALDAALRKEPGFFAAAALATRLQAAQIDAERTSGSACRQGFAKLFGYLARLLDSEPCPRLAIHVENYLLTFFADQRSSPAVLAAQVYLALLARRPPAAVERLEALSAAPRFDCQREVVEELSETVERVAGGRDWRDRR